MFQIGFPTSTNVHRFFLTAYLFFLREKADFGFILNPFLAVTWGSPVSGCVARRRTLIGR
jgi:hypothetical protein